VEVSQRVRAELDKLYAPRFAACRWAAHKPLLVAQRNRLEDLILRVLEGIDDAAPSD
jgi:hypothetical protein